MSIAKKIYVTLLVGLFFGLLAKEFIMDKQLQATQFNRAKAEAMELRNSIMVFRDYIDKLNEQNGSNDEIKKAHPLNTVIEENFIYNSKNNVRIKTVSNKPVLPQNLANAKETEDIKYFDKHSDENERFSIYKDNNTEFYHYSYALRARQKCLSCHTDYKLGDTRGIISIHIDKKNFDRDRILLSNNSYTVTFIVLMIIFVILYFVVIKPLSGNMKKFQNNLGQFFSYINDEDDEIDFQAINSSDELGVMSKEIHTNIIKAKKVIQSQKKSHELLKKMKDDDEQNGDNRQPQGSSLAEKAKSLNLLLNDISATLHTPLKELKNHLHGIDAGSASLDKALAEISYIENILNHYPFFFEQANVLKTLKLRDIIQKCNTENRSAYEKLEIEIIDDYEDIVLTTYENALHQILLSILQASTTNLNNSSYEERLILISTFQSKDKTSINIKDNAGGISPTDLEKLFDPQIKVSETFNFDSLKLYISREVLKNHLKGELEVVNIDIDYKGKSFKGSEFIITLPNKR